MTSKALLQTPKTLLHPRWANLKAARLLPHHRHYHRHLDLHSHPHPHPCLRLRPPRAVVS